MKKLPAKRKWKTKKFGRKGNPHVSLDRLIEVLQAAQKDTNGGAVVEFWCGNTMFSLKNIGHFSVLPDVIIDLKKLGEV